MELMTIEDSRVVTENTSRFQKREKLRQSQANTVKYTIVFKLKRGPNAGLKKELLLIIDVYDGCPQKHIGWASLGLFGAAL